MALSFDISTASRGINGDAFEQVNREFDVFSRCDLGDEVIIDTCGWDATEEPLQNLSKIVGEPPEELAGLYLVLYVDRGAI